MSFNVLARAVELNQNILVEASAGTGKTFTIEHLFIRRLLTQPRRSVKEIAVLTFTNAVAKELAARLKKAVEKSIADLRSKSDRAPDYLLAYIEQGKQDEIIALLETARDEIDCGAIDTIHGFCYRCLSEFTTGSSSQENNEFVEPSQYLFYIEEFFRSLPVDDGIELKELLKKHHGRFSDLLEEFASRLWDEESLPLMVRCREFVRRELKKRSQYAMQELLLRMDDELQNGAFVHFVKQRFSCLIVDEFQDTDPVQWKIIQKLFTGIWRGFLYLVGDPKQAIYSFRKADVYCYMQAKTLPHLFVATLATNFRSSQELVAALNTLFHEPLFYLPKLKSYLDVPKITSGARSANIEGPAMQFFIAKGAIGKKRNWPTEELEEHYFFPFIANEIKNLQVAKKEIAILVKDRYQAHRLEAYLASRALNSVSWKKKSLVDSEAFLFLERFCRALHSVRKRACLIDLVLQKPFLYAAQTTSRLIDDLEFWAEHVACLLNLKEAFDSRGLAASVHAFLQGIWPGFTRCMKEHLWDDKEFLYDLDAIVELALDHAKTVEALQEFLFDLKRYPQSEKEHFPARSDPEDDAVQIVTLHSSKGLEFDVVFALGVVNRTKEPDEGQDADELDAEKLRQFYVAATRARRKLYLAVALQEDLKKVKQGCASPMELYLAKNSIESLVAKSCGTISATNLVKTSLLTPVETMVSPQKAPLLFQPLYTRANKYFITSFTQLNDKGEATFVKKEETVPPAGVESGILFHELIAECLQSGRDPDASFLEERLKSTVLEGFVDDVLVILQRALAVEFGSFSLKDVDRVRLAVEVPFCLKENDKRFLRGSIDCLFEHEEKYYLVDWKSNALETYCKAALQTEVKTQGYDMQAAMYSAACSRFQKSFGGFYFVFLRGLPNDGVLLYE